MSLTITTERPAASRAPYRPGRMIRQGEPGYQQCTVTIMDTTDPDISFDEHGVCHWVTDVFPKIQRIWNPEGSPAAFQRLIDRIQRDARRRDYDCILGLSGGLDSSYLAYVAWKAGLRPLVVHTDTGWNSEIAVNNIERIVNTCGFELHTNVIDWQEMADIQRAFLRANVPNQDIPQDHAIFASLYSFATRNRVRWVLSGSNFASESILPLAWGHNNRDAYHIRAIHRRFGQMRLRRFPFMGQIKYGLVYRLLGRMKVASLLNCVRYYRKEAIATLEQAFQWRYYGAKHFESRWTRFFQGYWLPNKFGFDKRLAHYSSLILSGQMTREEALEQMAVHEYTPEMIRDDRDYIFRKLNMSEEEFEGLLRAPRRKHTDYPTSQWISQLMARLYTPWQSIEP